MSNCLKKQLNKSFLRIFVSSQSGDHPLEDLAKYGYRPQIFYHPSICLATQ
jgi:hypothetical protein